MLRRCDTRDPAHILDVILDVILDTIQDVIQDGARAYRAVVPPDCRSKPGMSRKHLQHELEQGVRFSAPEKAGVPAAGMGIQAVKAVPAVPASWAIRFCENVGWQIVSPEAKAPLLGKDWPLPGRQVETSVVLADPLAMRSVVYP